MTATTHKKKRKWLRGIKLPAWAFRTAGFAAIRLMDAWLSTLNLRMWRYDPAADPAEKSFAGPALYIFWHEYILLPIYIRPHCKLTMLLSAHQDAEVLSHVARYAGMGTIRGSTYRDSVAALRKMLRCGQGVSLAVVPDGPRGPRRKLAQGCVYLSSRLQIPIVAVGMGFDRPWRARRAWDQFVIPKPFSCGRVLLGPRIQVPANLDRDALEQHRQWIERQLEQLTSLAEEWAAGRCQLPQDEALYRLGPGQLDTHRSQRTGSQRLEASGTEVSQPQSARLESGEIGDTNPQPAVTSGWRIVSDDEARNVG
ncbi:MAG: DUF374 domain-containing protein [Pirellulaceae bacterium]|nr:DUF374 domain-containing protein [Pirellulaceae bacterium]